MSNDAPHDDFSDDLQTEGIGYTEVDWDQLDQAEADLHDEIIGMELEQARALKLGTLTDLQRWAVAQVYADNDDFEGFERICRELLGGSVEHPALDYGAIGTELVHDLLVEERFDDARALLPRVAELCADDGLTERRFTAILEVVDGDEDRGIELFDALIEVAGTDSYLLFDIATDLANCGLFEAAVETFDQVRQLALDDADSELVEFVDVHTAQLREIIEELDDDEDEA
ncbi:MAG: hypothetical protein EA398_01380 [Deltaproteobacteria bacterium]|nr:MAG: hypothetical protein EA398_01380 [Deltaproteobacteria bacterium]